MSEGKLDVVWDMETGDPDDFLTLLLLLGHPRVNLKAVTIAPGTRVQVGLVRRALSWFDRDIPVGAYDIDSPKDCVSGWHYRAYGEAPPSGDAEPAAEALARECDENATLVTGAPPKNLGAAIKRGGLTLGCWMAQGGFAGEGVVPAGRQLAKFKGMRTCPTFNFNGAPKAVFAALAEPGIRSRYFVSKNVCHGVVYDQVMHAVVGAVKERSLALRLIWKGMDAYLRATPEGKKFHDPLAACCAINRGIGEWAEVELFRERGEWGARLAPGSGQFIITGYDHQRFVDVQPEGTRQRQKQLTMLAGWPHFPEIAQDGVPNHTEKRLPLAPARLGAGYADRFLFPIKIVKTERRNLAPAKSIQRQQQ
jgi:hypothetical protein